MVNETKAPRAREFLLKLADLLIDSPKKPINEKGLL